jgi:hypothetical protein
VDRERDRHRPLHRDHDQQPRGIATHGEHELPAGAWERDESDVAWIYGSILTAAAVAVATDIKASKPVDVLLYTAATMVVVWLAHSYGVLIGHGGRIDLPGRSARLWHALRTELPLLACALPTFVALAICAVTDADLETTGFAGLAVAISVMVLVAAGAAKRTGAKGTAVLIDGASALVLGGIIVVLKVSLG